MIVALIVLAMALLAWFVVGVVWLVRFTREDEVREAQRSQLWLEAWAEVEAVDLTSDRYGEDPEVERLKRLLHDRAPTLMPEGRVQRIRVFDAPEDQIYARYVKGGHIDRPTPFVAGWRLEPDDMPDPGPVGNWVKREVTPRSATGRRGGVRYEGGGTDGASRT